MLAALDRRGSGPQSENHGAASRRAKAMETEDGDGGGIRDARDAPECRTGLLC